MAEVAYYRRTRIVNVNDLLVARMNLLNPEYPCIHCNEPVVDHSTIELDWCALRSESQS